jgi:hypothetical protein
MPKTPAFMTTVYGRKYAYFLGPHLRSILQTHPDADGLVLWQDLPPCEIDLMRIAFPSFRFEQATTAMDGSLHQRIPRKLHAWRDACIAYPDRPICLLDCDTLVVKPLDRFFEPGWDVTFTHKNEQFPLNTGVMLVRTGAIGETVMDELLRRVESIVQSPTELDKAVNTSGAADQHALRQVIGWDDYDRDITTEIDGAPVVFRGQPCSVLNETNCAPITDDLHIIHYKTGWHPILIDGADFTPNRPATRCEPMHTHWQRHLADTNAQMVRELVFDACAGAYERFSTIAPTYEERGILNSEMLAACATCERLGVDLIIESGRCRAQSTLAMARFFRNTKTRIISIELEHDENAKFAAQRLAGFKGVELLFGDSFAMLPELLRENAHLKVALLMDGPKGLPALELIQDCFDNHAALCAAFLHDVRRETPQRATLDQSGARVLCTDDEAYVSRYQALDEVCKPRPEAPITMHTWRPWKKGEDAIPSYGPTLAVILASPPGVGVAPPSVLCDAAAVGHGSIDIARS